MTPIPEAKRVIPAEVLDLPLKGLGLSGQTLREQVADQASVLAFLRHFG